MDPVTRWREQLAALCAAAEHDEITFEDLVMYIGEHVDDADMCPMLALLAHAYAERIRRAE